MAFLGLDPGDPNNWYQSPYLGLSPAGYGGGISGGYYRAPYHPYGSSTCAFTQFSSQPSPYPPLQLNPSATIINGHLFPHHFPGVAQQPLTTTPRDPYIPTYHSPHSNSNPGIYPSISQKYSYDPSGIGVHSQFIFTNAMTTPPIYPSAPSPPACEQPQYHRNTSIPTFQSPLDPTFVPQLQFSDPKPPSSFRPMSDCENHLRLDAILDSTPTGAAHYTPTQAPDGSSLPPSIDFDGNSDSENKESIAPNLKTNEEYACRYEDLKKRGLVDEHSGSDSSSEDDDVVVVLAANSKKKNLEFFEANIKVKVLDPILNNKEVGLSKSIDNEIEDTSLVKAENCKAMELGFKRHNELEEIYIEVHMDVDSDGARQILNSLIGLGNGHYPEFNSRYESHSPKSNETKTSKGSELALGGLWDDSGGLNTMQSKFKSFCKPGLVPGDFALIHDEDHILEDHEKSAIVTHSPQLCQKAGVKCKSCDGDLVGIVEDSQFYYFKKDKRSSAKEQVWAIYDDDERLRNYGLVDAVFNPGISISFVTLKLMAFNSCMSGNMSMDKERVQAFDDGTMGHGHQVENWLSLSLKPTSSLISPLEPYILMEVGGASTILMVVGETSTNYDQGVVPPNSTLYYEVELLSFVKDKEPWDMNTLEKMEVAVSLLEQDFKTGPSDQSGLNFFSGIICKSKALMFERMLFHATSIWIALHDLEKSVTKAVEDFWDCYGNEFGTDYLGLFKAGSHVHYTVRYAAAEVLAAALDKSPDSIQESLSTLLLMYVCATSLSESNVNTGWLKVDSEMVMCSTDAQSDAKLWPWLILCLQLYHWETKKSILFYREAFNQMGEMSQTTLSQNGPTLAGKDNLIGIVAIIDWFRCALSEFGTVATLNAWLNDNFLCLPLENKPEKMTLFLADKLKKMGHKWLLTKSAAVMFVSKDGKYVALGSKDVDTFVVVIKKMEHEFIELRNHFLSQGVVNLLEEVSELAFAKFGPSVILLTGLQGIGKTTIFTTLKMAFLLCQVALTRMGKLQDERFLFSGSFSYDNYACFDIVMAKQLPNAACHSILFRLILGALRQESSEALRRWQYALLLSSFQYCQHMLNLDIPSTVLQFLLLDEQEVEDLDLQKISREQAEVAHGNFFILRKKAQSVLDLVINDSTQGCEIGEMMSLYVLDAIICVDHDGVHSQNSMQQQAQTLEAELALLLKIKYLFASFISRDEDYYACVEGREIISNLSITAASIFLLNLLVQPEHEHRKWSAAISVGLISSGLYITDLKQKFEKCLGVVKSTFKRNQSFLQLYLPYISVGKAFTGLQNEYQIDQVDVRAVIAIVIIQLHSNEATELCKGMDKLLQAFGIYTAFAYLAYHLCSVGPQLLIEQFIDVAFVGNFYDTNVDQWLPAHDERFICKGTKRISRRLLTLLQNPFANVRMGMMTPSCTSNDKLGVHEATKTDQLADKDNVSFHQWGITFVIFYFEFVYHFFLSQCCWYNILVKMLHMVDFFQDAPHAPIF